MAGQSRPKRASDELYNIRRRFKRAAARYEKQAAMTEDETAKRQLLAAAGAQRRRAENLYVRNIASKEVRQDSKRLQSIIQGYIKRTREDSLRSRAKDQKGEQERRDEMAKSILSGTKGQVFYASTIKAWRFASPKERNEEIVAYFQKAFEGREDIEIRDLLDVITLFEQETQIPFLDPGAEDTELDDRYNLSTRTGMLFMSEIWSSRNAQ